MDIDRLMTDFAERQQLGSLTTINNQYEVIIDQRMAEMLSISRALLCLQCVS